MRQRCKKGSESRRKHHRRGRKHSSERKVSENNDYDNFQGRFIRFPVKLGMWDIKQCDRKRCTAQKLYRKGYVALLRFSDRFRGIVLDADTPFFICSRDRSIVDSAGLAIIDCSWKRICEVPFARINANNKRCLPFLIACNPVNYGRAYQLSSAEALASALFIVGHKEAARSVLSVFKWGTEFMRRNGSMLEEYSRCETNTEIIAAERRFQDEYVLPRPDVDFFTYRAGQDYYNPNRTFTSDEDEETELDSEDSDLDINDEHFSKLPYRIDYEVENLEEQPSSREVDHERQENQEKKNTEEQAQQHAQNESDPSVEVVSLPPETEATTGPEYDMVDEFAEAMCKLVLPLI